MGMMLTIEQLDLDLEAYVWDDLPEGEAWWYADELGEPDQAEGVGDLDAIVKPSAADDDRDAARNGHQPQRLLPRLRSGLSRRRLRRR
jgi:hypothetical protein